MDHLAATNARVKSTGRVIASYSRQYAQSRRAVGEARRAVVAFARTCGFAGQALDDIEIAVGEALANAYEHGQCDRGTFEVDVRRDETALTIEVKDAGRGFDHGATLRHERPPLESLRGFGTFIMRELMDEIEYSERGTRLRLVKRLPERELEERPFLEA